MAPRKKPAPKPTLTRPDLAPAASLSRAVAAGLAAPEAFLAKASPHEIVCFRSARLKDHVHTRAASFPFALALSRLAGTGVLWLSRLTTVEFAALALRLGVIDKKDPSQGPYGLAEMLIAHVIARSKGLEEESTEAV